ncbi:2-methylisocitrate lyase-like PEP mutase family enzyme [Nocardiopsis sp. Huas11]|uniref:isocitrate lyase/PEP mutase family protein n=1 Tax=Nocardiopsis sp. Huas11 TaxID=2183912 RepID=UPI000EAEE2F1|nr:isocitrate lyase/phosphoenolpyruvate mutase family protein [Nocardiopsis sp. Huas11]RKS05318.1 2-methylisocitrate lyase-like PEP mutase family enzyme [Nocardiopsis sp. Huas11]
MTRFEEFRDLHRTGAPLVLPNAWDLASAAALAEAGFRALGTTSLGVATAAGLPDAQGDTRAETVRLAHGMVRLDALVSVDVEGGFGDEPEAVAALAAELAGAGVAGINIEDGRPDGGLRALDAQCALIEAVKDAAPDLFVNARTDTHWLPGHAALTAERAEAYRAAGADGVFVPGLTDASAIADLVGALDVPLNILYSPAGPSLRALTDLGVRRVSCGSLLFRAALHATVATARAVARDEPVPAGLPGYAEAQALADAYTARP